MDETFKLKILYVEDDKNLNEEYQTFFNRRCDELFIAFDGKEGYESYIKNQPDLIITDITMPKSNGIEMIKKIRKVDTKTPVIVTSAYNDEDYLLEAINQGVSRYIIKPFNRKLLKQIIEEAISFIKLRKKENYYITINDEYYEIIDNNILGSRTDLDGIITYVSKAFCKISGYSKEELIGSSHNIIAHPDMDKSVYKEMWETITNNKVWKGEIKNRAKNGEFYWIYATISPIFNENGEKIAYSSIRENITDKKRLEELSIKDSLTNIYNRRYFNEKIIELLKINKRRDEAICLLIIDIDDFKLYNDTYGHQKGDNVLIKVANALSSFMQRADDYCFRIGGEEFAILFKTKDLDTSVVLSNKVKDSIEHLQIKHELNSASDFVTISVGLYCDNANNIENDMTFFKKADDLLYKAKEQGKNRVAFEN